MHVFFLVTTGSDCGQNPHICSAVDAVSELYIQHRKVRIPFLIIKWAILQATKKIVWSVAHHHAQLNCPSLYKDGAAQIPQLRRILALPSDATATDPQRNLTRRGVNVLLLRIR